MAGYKRARWAFLGLCILLLVGCMLEKTTLQPVKPVGKPLRAPQAKDGSNEIDQQAKASPPLTNEPAKPVVNMKPKVRTEKVTNKLTVAERKQLEALKSQPLFYRGPAFRKQVALTFDDGPDERFTPQVLAILKKEQVPATFFVVGKMVERYPEVVRQIVEEGHVVGNHSYSHKELTKLSLAQVDAEIDRTGALVYDAIHKKPLFIRPPYGAIDDEITLHLGKRGYKVIQWSVDTLDWRKGNSPYNIVDKVKANIEAGGIILQHSFGGTQIGNSVEALPYIIKYLEDSGYEFVTVDRLLDIPAYSETE
ncbi:polysaccharide deacetylase family protein [Laceyella putida]|uniref:Polysaccharide deacetylase family protein n=1 Tax=Laceyella putida TaxID=110101 RepID=A0ABW2RJE6_9BACL